MELVVPSKRTQFIVDRVAVHAEHRQHVGEDGVGDGAGTIGGVAGLQDALAPLGAKLHAGLDFGLVVLGIEHVDRALVKIVRSELQRAHPAVTLVLVVELVQLAASEHLGAVGTIGVAPGFVLEAGRRAVEVGIADRQADHAVLELVDVGEAVAVSVGLVAIDLVLVRAEIDRHHAILEIQRSHGLQVDGAGQALADQRCIRSLVDDHAAEQLRGVLVEFDTAVVAGADLLAAVERGAGEVAGKAADIDLGGPATLPLRGQAGQAGDRLGDGGIRQFADVLGRHRFNDRGRLLLGIDGVLDAAADAGDRDRLEFLHRLTATACFGFGLGRRVSFGLDLRFCLCRRVVLRVAGGAGEEESRGAGQGQGMVLERGTNVAGARAAPVVGNAHESSPRCVHMLLFRAIAR